VEQYDKLFKHVGIEIYNVLFQFYEKEQLIGLD